MLKNRKLIVVVVEAALEQRLSKDILFQGAKGFTITHANGLGPRNQRAGDLEGGNIRLETVVPEEISMKILELLKTSYSRTMPAALGCQMCRYCVRTGTSSIR